MDIINLSSNFFSENPDFKGTEAKLYIYESKIIKIFSSGVDISSKIAKIRLLHDINEDIIKPTNIVYVNGGIMGYAMDYKKGFVSLEEKGYNSLFIKKIQILKEVLRQLEILHKHGIIYGDLHLGNVIVNKNKAYLCDLDNVMIGNCSFNTLNSSQQRYQANIKDIDIHLDYYLFNTFLAAFLYEIYEPYADNFLFTYPEKFRFLNKDYIEIIEAMKYLNPKSKDKIKPLIKI